MSEALEPTPTADAPATPEGKRKPRRLLLGLAVIGGVALVAAGWWLVDRSTVPVGDYDEVVVQRDALADDLASATTQIDTLEASIADLERQRTELAADLSDRQAEVGEMTTRFAEIAAAAESAREYIEVLAAERLLVVSDDEFDEALSADVTDLIAARADIASTIGWFETADQYSLQAGFSRFDVEIYRLSDDRVGDLYDRYLASEPGSEEEILSLLEFYLALDVEALNALDDAIAIADGVSGPDS